MTQATTTSVPLPSSTASPAAPDADRCGHCRLALGKRPQATSHHDLVTRLARLLSEVVRADIIVVGKANAKGEVQLDGVLHPISGLPELTTRSFGEYTQQSLQDRSSRAGRIGRPPNQLLVAVPVLTAPASEVLLALFVAPPASPDVLTTVVELAASHHCPVRSADRGGQHLTGKWHPLPQSSI